MRCPVLCFGCQRSAVIRFIGDDIFADYLRNMSSRIVRYGPNGTLQGEIPIPEHHVATLRSHGEGVALLSLTSLLTPQTVLELDLETLETEEWRPSPVPFDGSPYEMTQVWYTSADGTEAPMYVAHRRGLELDGATPALLYGYGGFNCKPAAALRCPRRRLAGAGRRLRDRDAARRRRVRRGVAPGRDAR